jgi:AcrR family transcriptional regulator
VARPAKFSDDDVLDAALAAVGVAGRDVTISDVTGVLGGPVGSVYYRFPTREHVLVGLWIRSVRRFQDGILDRPPPTAAAAAGAELERCARHVVTYCRDHPTEARALTLYRQAELLPACPPDLQDQVRTLNDAVVARMLALTDLRYGRVTPRRLALARTAVQQGPYGLVRPHVGGPVPVLLDAVVVASARAILALGD